MENYQITDSETGQVYFEHEELACPISGEVRLAAGFEENLRVLRKSFGEPMVVTSCCRSPKHNQRLIREGLPAHPLSLHLTMGGHPNVDGCCALDIRIQDSEYAWRLTKLAMSQGWSVGIANGFIHLDMRSRFLSRASKLFRY